MGGRDCRLQELSCKSKDTAFPVILSKFLLSLIGPNRIICLSLNQYMDPGGGILQINLGWATNATPQINLPQVLNFARAAERTQKLRLLLKDQQ